MWFYCQTAAKTSIFPQFPGSLSFKNLAVIDVNNHWTVYGMWPKDTYLLQLKPCINSRAFMHIARDDIRNSARTKGGGHLLKTKLKTRGLKMIRTGEKDARFQSFAQGWGKSNRTIVVWYIRVLIAFWDGNKYTIPKKLWHKTMSLNYSKQRS